MESQSWIADFQINVHADYRSTTKIELARAIVSASHCCRPGHHLEAFQEYAARAHQGDDAISRAKMGQLPSGSLSRGASASARLWWTSSLCCVSTLRIHLSASRDQNYPWRDSSDRPLREGRKIS